MSEELEQELLWVINHEEVVSTSLKREEIIEIYKEIVRLNNIIEEIEQYCLDEQIPEEYPDYNDFTELFNSIYDKIYNKIQELKGDDK